jgi:hypothetical protein
MNRVLHLEDGDLLAVKRLEFGRECMWWSTGLAGIRCEGTFGHHPSKHRIDSQRWQLGSSVKPPSQHGYVGSYYILNGQVLRDNLLAILVDRRGQFVVHQIAEYLPNGTKDDSAAPTPRQRAR